MWEVLNILVSLWYLQSGWNKSFISFIPQLETDTLVWHFQHNTQPNLWKSVLDYKSKNKRVFPPLAARAHLLYLNPQWDPELSHNNTLSAAEAVCVDTPDMMAAEEKTGGPASPIGASAGADPTETFPHSRQHLDYSLATSPKRWKRGWRGPVLDDWKSFFTPNVLSKHRLFTFHSLLTRLAWDAKPNGQRDSAPPRPQETAKTLLLWGGVAPPTSACEQGTTASDRKSFHFETRRETFVA